MSNWSNVLGRVSFVNCDPLFHGLPNDWEVLPAPPAWLTGHLLRKDCLVAPIPTADYAKHHSELVLLPNIGIASDGDVGSVLLFSNRELDSIRDIALPSDSSTSSKLVMYILEHHGLDPKATEMGPDLDEMLNQCDAALLIGDRALDEAYRHPELVKLDLGAEWKNITGLPMVFAVFAAPIDSDVESLRRAHRDLSSNARNFNEDMKIKEEVIISTSIRSGFSSDRVKNYFSEVTNILDDHAVKGLEYFLQEVCEIDLPVNWLDV
ncbi:MAG: menaquinone biosynthesis protein [Candidatus Thalassarchaeaceae archaeon]|jgi:chorismate dehydratase|nr:menaquinone biosynthesis protein [Candidatus Thalassarchaeaceae archaeon]